MHPVLEQNQGWQAFYDQQREAHVQSLNTQLRDLKQELVQNTEQAQERQVGSTPIRHGTTGSRSVSPPSQVLLLARDLKKAMVDRQRAQQNFREAQEQLSRLESTLEEIHLSG